MQLDNSLLWSRSSDSIRIWEQGELSRDLQGKEAEPDNNPEIVWIDRSARTLSVREGTELPRGLILETHWGGFEFILEFAIHQLTHERVVHGDFTNWRYQR